MTEVEIKDLVPGRVYDICLDDCCINGWLRGRFLRYEEDEVEVPYGEYVDLVFDIGFFTNYNRIVFYEYEPGAEEGYGADLAEVGG